MREAATMSHRSVVITTRASNKDLRLVFHPDGQVTAQADGDIEHVEFSADRLMVSRLVAEKNSDLLEELFWTAINSQQDDPFLGPDEDKGTAWLETARGTVEEMEDLLADLLDASADFFATEDARVLAYSCGPDGTVKLEAPLGSPELAPAITHYAEAIFHHFAPTGWQVVPGDGPSHRRSSLDQVPRYREVWTSAPSDSERGAAIDRLQRTDLINLSPDTRSQLLAAVTGEVPACLDAHGAPSTTHTAPEPTT